MRNFQDTFEIRKRSFIIVFSICMAVSFNKVFKGIEKMKREDKKLTVVKLKFYVKGYSELKQEEISSLSKTTKDFFHFINCFMHNVVKWPNIFQKSCGVNTARFLKYVWPFYNILHKRVKSFGKNEKQKKRLLVFGWSKIQYKK